MTVAPDPAAHSHQGVGVSSHFPRGLPWVNTSHLGADGTRTCWWLGRCAPTMLTCPLQQEAGGGGRGADNAYPP